MTREAGTKTAMELGHLMEQSAFEQMMPALVWERRERLHASEFALEVCRVAMAMAG